MLFVQFSFDVKLCERNVLKTLHQIYEKVVEWLLVEIYKSYVQIVIFDTYLFSPPMSIELKLFKVVLTDV